MKHWSSFLGKMASAVAAVAAVAEVKKSPCTNDPRCGKLFSDVRMHHHTTKMCKYRPVECLYAALVGEECKECKRPMAAADLESHNETMTKQHLVAVTKAYLTLKEKREDDEYEVEEAFYRLKRVFHTSAEVTEALGRPRKMPRLEDDEVDEDVEDEVEGKEEGEKEGEKEGEEEGEEGKEEKVRRRKKKEKYRL